VSDTANDSDPMIGVAEVAKLLGLTPRTITRLVSQRQFAEPYRVGGTFLWRTSEFQAWLESTKQMRPAAQEGRDEATD
jgi:excisionase family DNA binding protein